MLGWATQLDLLTLVGVTVAVGGALISWYYQRHRMRLLKEKNQREAAESAIRIRNLLLDEQIKIKHRDELEARMASHIGQDVTK